MDITIVPIEVFLDHLPYSGTPKKHLQDKAQWLANTFSCFQEAVNEPKKWQRSERNVVKPSRNMEKPRIGNRDLSKENIARKDFVSHMNKLTASNKQSIFKQIQQSLRIEFLPNYIQWIWEYMLSSPAYQDLYIEVISIVATSGGVKSIQDILVSLWDTYCHEKKWIATPDIFEEQEYDEFCSYLLWKKKAIASVQAWIRLGHTPFMNREIVRELFTYLLNSCSEHMSTPSKTLEVLLEQMLQYMALHTPDLLELHAWVDEWKPTFAAMPPAIRFKLCDVEEMIQGKNEIKPKNKKGR